MHRVFAQHLPDEYAEKLQEKAASDEDVLLVAMLKKPGASLRELAMQCGWVDGLGKPRSRRVEQRMHRLNDLGLVTQDRKSKWLLTNKGRDEASRLP